LAIPGVGPVVAAAARGHGRRRGGRRSSHGGIVGALTQAGVSDEDARSTPRVCAAAARWSPRRVNDADASRLEAILDRSSLRTNEMRSSYDNPAEGLRSQSQAVLG
jgi:hypothetical protein